MRDPVMVLVVGSSLAASLGLFLLVTSALPHPARLGDALELLDGRPRVVLEAAAQIEGDWATRWGNRLVVRLNLPVQEWVRRTLALQGRSVGDWVTEKCLRALSGLAAPVLLIGLLSGFGQVVAPLPLGLSVVLGVLGWFHPTWSLRQSQREVGMDAGEALHSFVDLVVLNRLSNRSATQSLWEAATMSDQQLFLRIRGALERARLEQRPPWGHLRSLSQETGLPQIAELAEVMQLDEQGAALADALRARVRDMRDAHLLAEKVAAQQLSERMTVWMVLPSMVFALLIVAPPLLRMAGVS